jgi:acetamidase/formamidase
MMSQQIQQELEVDQYTLGLVGPEQEWAGTVADGGTVRTHTPPACWGPMITPRFRGGHEVTRPIRVENAEPGDALVVRIKDVEVTSVATSTGSMLERDGAFGDDPFIDHRCPGCGTEWPETVVEGVGEDAVRCANCGENASSFGFEYGYTVVFDDDRSVGLTVGSEGASRLAEDAAEKMALPENSRQHPILLYAPDEIPGTLGRLRPFIGNIGTTPSVELPDSHNAGDFGQFLVGADHDWGIADESELEARTDGHLDSNDVRAGATLVCPVEIDGAGLYVGDLHANQGDGELSLHTTDVSGRTELEVEVVKDVNLDGPLLLPNESDLPDIAKPYADAERATGEELADQYGVDGVVDAAPVQFIGSGATINDATQNAFDRAASLFDVSEGEVRARCTFTGGVEIARLPGVVQLSMLAPVELLDAAGLTDVVLSHYGR